MCGTKIVSHDVDSSCMILRYQPLTHGIEVSIVDSCGIMVLTINQYDIKVSIM